MNAMNAQSKVLKAAKVSVTISTENETCAENAPATLTVTDKASAPSIPVVSLAAHTKERQLELDKERQPELEQEHEKQPAAVHKDEREGELYVLDNPFEIASSTTEKDKAISDNDIVGSALLRPPLAPDQGNQPAQPINRTDDNPFDISADVFTLFESEPSAATASGSAESEQAIDNAEPTYVFGNPFEGPLPDVFTSDDDLRRVVREQQEEQRHSSEKVAPRETEREAKTSDVPNN
jgi:hypothetical protein